MQASCSHSGENLNCNGKSDMLFGWRYKMKWLTNLLRIQMGLKPRASPQRRYPCGFGLGIGLAVLILAVIW